MAEITDPGKLAQLNANGDDFLHQLAATHGQGYASLVKATAEGANAAPTGMAMRSPFGQQLVQDVYQYDPTADAVNLPARTAARKAFMEGKQGQNYLSIATALDHSAVMDDAISKLGNVQSPVPFTTHLVNSVRDKLRDLDGNTGVTQFQNTVTPIVDELERAYTQTGGSVTAIRDLREGLNMAQSPQQQRTAVQTFAKLLAGKLDELNQAYNRAMGTTGRTAPGMTPHAQQLLASYTSPDYVEKGLAGIAPHPPGGDNNPPPAVGPGGGGPTAPAGGPSGAPPGSPPPPLDPNHEGDIGFNQMGGGGAPKSPLNPAQQAAYDAFNKANPKATADQLRAFGQSINVNFGNADEVVKARDLGGGVRPGADAINAPVGPDDAGHTAVNEYANSATFGVLPKISALAAAGSDKINGLDGSFGDLYDKELARKNGEMTASQAAHPYAALAGDTAGFISGDGILTAAPGVAKLAGRIPGTLRPIAGDLLYGGAYGAGSSDSLADVPGNILKGGMLAAGGGMLGRGLVKGVANIASPVANAAVRRLTDAGVTLTPGQILGGGGIGGKIVKGVEDRLSGFPIVGDIINNARRGGVEDFNGAAINDALAPIGASLPDGMPKAGHDAIAHAQSAVSDAYDNALGAMHAVPDPQFETDLKQVGAKAKTLSADNRERLSNILDTDLQPYLNGKKVLDGSDLQAIKQGLDKRISSLSGQGSSPQDRELAERLGDARDAVLSLAGRTDPASAADFQKANQAFSLLSRVQAAAAKSKDGVFSPNQFRQAVTKRGYGTTTANVARGDAPMQQLSTDASTILPSSVPDSGTSGRAALGLLAGKLGAPAAGAVLGGAGGHETPVGTIGGALLGASLFTRPGLKVTQKILAGSRGRKLDTLGDLLRRNANLGGAVGTPLLLDRSLK